MAKKWIQGAIQHPGALRKALHVKEGSTIPAQALNAAANKPGVMGKRARLAKVLRVISARKKVEKSGGGMPKFQGK